MTSTTMRVTPATAETWPELERLFGQRGDQSGCWCQWFKLTGAEYRATSREEKSELLHRQVSGTPTAGVIAWAGDDPVGWSAVEPYGAYPGLARSPITKRLDGDPVDDLWAVTCFVVRLDSRRQGVARALLSGAVDHARSDGARVIEGYPVDPAVRPSLSAAERYHGTVSLFESGGFTVVRRPSATRAIMRLELAD
jgi:GNAT superfamily N-acetyltransferase